MKKATKHSIICVFLVVVCMALTICAAAARIEGLYVMPTDISAFIDGYEIPAYNISDKLGVVAEDLRGYGFNVVWNGEARTLSVSKNTYGVTAPIEEITHNTKRLPVYATDIVTYIDGNVVESFNVGGETVIFFSELARYGNSSYDNDCRASFFSSEKHSFAKKTIEALPRKIIHAGGEIYGMLGSNSLEALECTYEKGYRVIEIDFVLSSDGHAVCLHDWSSYYSDLLTSQPISKAEFEKVKIFNQYTSMTLDSLVEWMKTHTDVYIVTDIKENNVEVLRNIEREHPEIISRIIPQIYQYEEYLPVRAMGYSNIVLTLYRLPTYNDKSNGKYNSAFAQKNGLLAVAGDLILAKPEFVSEFVALGVPLYVHTVNDEAEQRRYLDMGITGVYTDYAR